MFTLRFRGSAAVLALAGALSAPPRAEANLFGLFHTRHRQTAVVAVTPVCGTCQSAYVAPAPVVALAPPPPQAACPTGCPTPQPIAVNETCMQQRCYQVPVTHMESRTAYQLVTSYQTSTVMEPVTTIRTSAYYDPCSCGYRSVSTPVTSYVQKAVVTPVQRYVAQNYQVPVTTYQQQCVNEPVTRTRYYYPGGTTPVGAPPPAAVGVGAPPPGVGLQPQAPPPQQQQQLAQPTQQPGQGGSIDMPNDGRPNNYYNVPSAPSASAEPLKPVPRENDASRYVSPFADKPNRRELVDDVYKDGKLVERHYRELDPNDAAAAGQTIAPRPPGVPALPRQQGSGSSYAPPRDQPPMPRGAKTASSVPQYPSVTVVLSKPYTY